MSEHSRRRSGELVQGVFRILLDQPDGLQAKEVIRRLEAAVPPTPFENSTYPNSPDVRRFEKIARFSTIPAVKAGWLVKNKGIWSLTPEGVSAFERDTDPEAFMNEALRLYRKWEASRPQEEITEEDDDTVKATTTLEEAEEGAWTEIEDYLKQMNPYDFQDLVAGLLRGMGYFIEWISPPGPDKGIDVLAHSDPLGVKGPRIKAQVKRREDKITVDGIRSFIALLSDADVGIFVSAGGFTRDAEEEARRQERRRIMLVDLKRLFDLWIEHYNKIPELQRRLLPLRPIYFLALED